MFKDLKEFWNLKPVGTPIMRRSPNWGVSTGETGILIIKEKRLRNSHNATYRSKSWTLKKRDELYTSSWFLRCPTLDFQYHKITLEEKYSHQRLRGRRQKIRKNRYTISNTGVKYVYYICEAKKIKDDIKETFGQGQSFLFKFTYINNWKAIYLSQWLFILLKTDFIQIRTHYFPKLYPNSKTKV